MTSKCVVEVVERSTFGLEKLKTSFSQGQALMGFLDRRTFGRKARLDGRESLVGLVVGGDGEDRSVVLLVEVRLLGLEKGLEQLRDLLVLLRIETLNKESKSSRGCSKLGEIKQHLLGVSKDRWGW